MVVQNVHDKSSEIDRIIGALSGNSSEASIRDICSQCEDLEMRSGPDSKC